LDKKSPQAWVVELGLAWIPKKPHPSEIYIMTGFRKPPCGSAHPRVGETIQEYGFHFIRLNAFVTRKTGRGHFFGRLAGRAWLLFGKKTVNGEETRTPNLTAGQARNRRAGWQKTAV